MVHLERIFVHPIKSFDATSVGTAEIVENGGLEWDRRYAVVEGDGTYVDGKRERRVHRLRAEYDLEAWTVALSASASASATGSGDVDAFHLEDDRDALRTYLSAFFDRPVELVRDDAGGLPNDADAAGPTVIASGTLETVASWYDGIDAAELRRRHRPNLVVAGPAFWEDRLCDRSGRVVPFSIGDASVRGINPCQRCVVPTRDPETGAPTSGFRETFVERREATLPEWAGREWFDHYFRLMINTRVPASSWGRRLAVGDELRVDPPVADPSA